MKNPHLVTQMLLVLLLGLQAYATFHPAVAPAPAAPVQPAASSALADAAKQYRDNIPGSFAGLRDGVAEGRFLTKQSGVAALAGARNPLGNALNATFDAHCDKDGTITDAAGLAADLDRAAKALGAK